MAALVFLGTPDAAVPPLRTLVEEGHDVGLVVTRPDKRRGRGGALVPSPVKVAAAELGLPVSDSLDDVAAVRAELGPEAVLITPGVRPSDSNGGDDQQRVATPARAAGDGANWLVVGRPIRDAADPLAVARAMRDEALGAMQA